MALHVFSGTKAQYIKLAPLIRLMDRRGIPYRLIDSGQHAGMASDLRTDLGVREPDVRLGGRRDVATIVHGVAWTLRLLGLWLRPARLRSRVFGGEGGVCVVHGDTVSTWLATVLARRAGLRVAHVEAGLRSRHLLHPFPEELVRILVMRRADILFAPDEVAVANLQAMRLRGRIVATGGNTVVDALRDALGDDLPAVASGPVVLSLHRLENLHRPARLRAFVALAARIARGAPARFVLHPPTRLLLERHGLLTQLRAAGVEVSDLVPHREFSRMVAAAPFVVTDGGSIQEESAALGVPCLLWRARTERPDGLGANVVVSGYDPIRVGAFLADPGAYRRDEARLAARPSEEILAQLLASEARQ
ncbi:MAG TPA: UDP-N-acetylglucosamine 2-epimerase [Egicoccus sp.]|nr:UDP-N-acetylglucosamine 2-epimerase [Egicoccus sp.]HSK22905.1 UDP-N-acetylglucosamine 2-epimerase [Egicoccus sp.]